MKEILKKQCLDIGGDAVLFCQFEFRDAISAGLMGSKQALEFFAYGTAVKLK